MSKDWKNIIAGRVARSRHHAPVMTVLVVGISLSTIVFYAARRVERSHATADFDREVDAARVSLETATSGNLEVLEFVQEFYRASMTVERGELGDFVDQSLLRHSGWESLEWAPRVRASDRRAFEEAAAKEGYPDVTIHPLTELDECFPVDFIVPYRGHAARHGYDLASDPDRLKTLERARDSGKMVATPPVDVLVNTGRQCGLLVCVPIYENGLPHETIEERRQHLAGFVIGVFQPDQLITDAFGEELERKVCFCVSDTTEIEVPRLLHCSHRETAHPSPAAGGTCPSHGNPADAPLGLRSDATVEFGGRRWSLTFWASPDRAESRATWLPYAATGISLLLSVLLAAYLGSVRRYTDRLAFANKSLGESEDRYRTLVENIHLGIARINTEHEVLMANAALAELVHSSPADLVGAKCYRAFECRDAVCDHCPGTVAMATGRVHEVEFIQAGLGGDTKFVRLQAVPTYGPDGEVSGFIELVEDITERKRAEEVLQMAHAELEGKVEERTAELARANERLREEMTWRLQSAERIARLNSLRESLIKPAELPEKLKIITDGIVSVLGADFARIWLTRPGDRCESGCVHAEVAEGPHVCRYRDLCLHLTASSGRYTHLDGKGHQRVPFGCYKIGRVAAAEDRGFLTNDVQNDPRVHNHEWARELELVAFAGYRLLASDGHPMGVLALFSRQAISAEEDALLEGLAHSTEQVVENAAAEAEIKALNAGLEKRVVERTSELALANDALREREATLRAITTSAQDAILMMGPEGDVSFWNEAAERILGWTEQEALGRNLHDFLAPVRFHEAHGRAFPHFQATGEGAAIGKTVELVAVRKDKTEFPVELSLSAMQLRDEWHAVGIMRDITERKRAELELAAMQQRLLTASREAGMAEVATSVLHNVGNVLNSVNVSASMAADQLRGSKIPYVGKIAQLLQEHSDDLGNFVVNDEKGRKLPAYVGQLAEHLLQEQSSAIEELSTLVCKIDHIKEIVAQQQTLAGRTSLVEDAALTDVVDEALHICGLTGEQGDVSLSREYTEQPRMRTDRHKVVQILVNLLRNAKDSLKEKGGPDLRVTVRIESAGKSGVRIVVSDNGVGVPAENLTRIFTHGFTTKPTGHGFGLHGSAMLAKELGGSLIVESAGSGLGARFVLELPTQPIKVKA